jgi:hypothetical protein
MKAPKKARYYLVPCDWCKAGIVEDCKKCDGSGSVAVVERSS